MESPLLGLILESSMIIEAERKRQPVEGLLTFVRETFGEIEIHWRNWCMAWLARIHLRSGTTGGPSSTN